MDRVTDYLESLLTCGLDYLSTSPSKSFIAPGATATWDMCEKQGNNDGQLWALVAEQLPNWPDPTGQVQRKPSQLTLRLELGIVRCQGAVSDGTTLPSGEAITEDGYKVHKDRYELMQAIVCCFSHQDLDFMFERWVPLGPSGGCVGGAWQFRIPTASCKCD